MRCCGWVNEGILQTHHFSSGVYHVPEVSAVFRRQLIKRLKILVYPVVIIDETLVFPRKVKPFIKPGWRFAVRAFDPYSSIGQQTGDSPIILEHIPCARLVHSLRLGCKQGADALLPWGGVYESSKGVGRYESRSRIGDKRYEYNAYSHDE